MKAAFRSCLLLPALLLLIACSSAPPDQPPLHDDGASWVTENPEDWPRIAVVNRIRYSDSNHPMAGSGFLLDTGDEIVAATAKHVLRFFKSEAMDSVSFKGTLVRWELFPKDDPSDVTVVGALINESPEESLEEIRAERDWLLFTVEQASESVAPLKLRETPLQKGEAVFVVGWRYTDEGRQHVYRGSYVRSEDGSVLIDVDELTDNKIPGLSGAPVIDARGRVIGMMSSKAGKLQRLASVDYPKQVLEQMPRPSSQPKTVASVDSAEECAQQMAEHFKRSGWVGITPEVDAAEAISVAEVIADSPAEKAGVRRGDLIRGVNGIPHTDREAFQSAHASFRPGGTAVFELERDGESLSVEIHIEPIPAAVLEQWIREECP